MRQGSADQGAPAYLPAANLKWKKTGKDRNNPPNARRENEHHKNEKSKHLHPHPSASIGRLLQKGLHLLLILVIWSKDGLALLVKVKRQQKQTGQGSKYMFLLSQQERLLPT